MNFITLLHKLIYEYFSIKEKEGKYYLFRDILPTEAIPSHLVGALTMAELLTRSSSEEYVLEFNEFARELICRNSPARVHVNLEGEEKEGMVIMHGLSFTESGNTSTISVSFLVQCGQESFDIPFHSLQKYE